MRRRGCRPLAQQQASSTGRELARSRAPPAAASRGPPGLGPPPWRRRAAAPVPDEEDACHVALLTEYAADLARTSPIRRLKLAEGVDGI